MMSESLSNKKDIQDTRKLFENNSMGGISIPKEKTPWFFLSPDYKSVYRHWLHLSNGNVIPVPCEGSKEGRGFAPNECRYCKRTLELYNKAKAAKQHGNVKKEKMFREAGNSLRASFSALFHAVKGNRILERVKTEGGYKKLWQATFEDIEGSEDEEGDAIEVGILALSKAQFENFTDLIGNPDLPYITTGDDLCNRVIWTQKKKKGKKKFPEVIWSADKKTREAPDVEIPEDQKDLEEFVKMTKEEFEKVWKDFCADTGKELIKRNKKREKAASVDDDNDDEDDELDEDEDVEDIDDDDDDDIEDIDDDDYIEEDDDYEDESDEDLPDDDFLDEDGDDTAEEEFEDDVPWEKDEEEKKKPLTKKVSKKSAGKTSATKSKGKVKL
jgi:hypothetical protein